MEKFILKLNNEERTLFISIGFYKFCAKKNYNCVCYRHDNVRQKIEWFLVVSDDKYSDQFMNFYCLIVWNKMKNDTFYD